MPPAKLEYASGPVHRGRILRRVIRIAVLVTLLVAAATSYRWTPPARQRAQLLYWQRQCLNYSRSPDRIVYDSEHPPADFAAEFPRCLIKFEQMVPNSGPSVGPLGWQSVSTRVVSNTPYISFLHERKSKGGTVRLVVIGEPVEGVTWHDTYTPTGVFGQPAPAQNFTDDGYSILLDPFFVSADLNYQPHRLRVYAGQTDPNDESHFTIAYMVNEKSDVIDGYLQDDGSIKIAFCAGPSRRQRPVYVGQINAVGPTTIPTNFNASPSLGIPIIGPRLGDLIDENPRRE